MYEIAAVDGGVKLTVGGRTFELEVSNPADAALFEQAISEVFRLGVSHATKTIYAALNKTVFGLVK